ncbi:energy transducer TonB [Flavobacterium pectinovorum]|uniref:energy transducer TonB n=1 Tax=Flavobacterium pectinovorum TaxID=29533 RepID=UPI00265F40F8|nr:energy transducer TonB [Flavobacterium pectinovorum]WKL50375.1 energy transducer TonB [Flavobacterium pectinovorum]
MKKFLILFLICFVQNIFSQNTQHNSETKNIKTIINDSLDYIFVDKSRDAVKDDSNKVYNSIDIDVRPEFPGGLDNFFKFVKENYKKPTENPELKGKVYVTFIVEKNGSLTDIKILRDIGFGTGAEAIRVLKKSPKWVSGELTGKKVRVAYGLPITIN